MHRETDQGTILTASSSNLASRRPDPLLLKKIKLDPALVSSPPLATVTDMCGFCFVLSFASLLLERL